jgi:PAS domain S-box-containing protein
MATAETEAHRIAVLRAYGVVDTAREPAYDEIAALTAALCEMPVAYISLVEENRQWFKAVHGADWQSTAREISFCAHAIEQRELFIVEDAATDPRFAANPLVCGEVGLRFYAGMPLVDGEGVALGALAVIDRVPRRLGAVQQQALRVLAGQVVAQFQGRRRQRMLEDTLLQRERGQAALRESEGRWRLLFERNPLPMWIFDIETLRFLAVNDAAVLQYGWAPSEFLSMTLKDIRPPEDVPALMEEVQEGRDTLHGGRVWRHRKKSGQLIHVDIASHSIPFDGRPARLVLAQDVTERLRAVQALRASEARWQRLFEASATGIAAARAEGLFASANPAYCRLVQRPETAVTGQPILAFTHPDDVPACQRELDRLAAGACETITVDKRYLRPDGSVRWVRAAITMTHGTDHSERQFVAVVHDIDAQRKAEEGLQRQHTLVQVAGRLARIGGWEVAKYPQQAVRWTDELRVILDIPPGETPTVEDGIHMYPPGSRETIAAALQACLDDGQPFDLLLEMQSARGRALHVRVIGEPQRDAAGRIHGAQGALIDLSAQRQTERQLRRQAALLDAARDAIVVRDLEDRITYWSLGAERLFGWSTAEATGHRAPELLAEDEVVVAHAREEVLRRGEWQAVVQCRARDGRPLRVDVRLTLLRDAAGAPEAVLAIKTDVTQRLALELQLQQAQRLEAVGQLTGGVAHDFNNLLTVIQGNAELLVEHLTDQAALAPLAQMAQMVSTAALRGAELTQRLLAFARKQPLQPQSVDAHQLLAGMDALLRRTLPEDIELELVRAAGLWPMLADPVQVESAVLNLVLNARDAMPHGGKITLETANAWIDQDYAERHIDVLPGQYVLISVSDTGVGMSGAELTRAFEPFFTTKGVGKGTGLGLSMVYGFAKQSRGHVKLYSEPGQGTTARLYLPRADGVGVPAAAAAANRTHGDLRGTATLLVVEDDDLVRRFATDLLRGLGYEVLAAENGVAALGLLRGRDDVELLFTDVVMPGGMNGRQLADAALALRPHMKVLFTSGYTENAIVHHGRLDRGVYLLAKPYRAVDLARKLRAMLG